QLDRPLVQLDFITVNSHHLGKKPPRLSKALPAGASIIAIAWSILAQEVLLRPDFSFQGRQAELDAIIDCTGAEEMIKLAFSVLSVSGHYVDVGLVGDRIDIPLFPRVSRERVFHRSFWGNYNDISEVMALMDEGKIRHTLKVFGFDQ